MLLRHINPPHATLSCICHDLTPSFLQLRPLLPLGFVYILRPLGLHLGISWIDSGEKRRALVDKDCGWKSLRAGALLDKIVSPGLVV